MKYIKNRSALKIFYYLISIDGIVTGDEIGTYMDVSEAIDKTIFIQENVQIREECKQWINKANKSKDELYAFVRCGVEEELKEGLTNSAYGSLSTKLLIWDMLTLAHSDREYASSEQRLITFVACKTELNDVCLMEMENAIKTARAVKEELNWIKTIDKPYAEIQNIVEELQLRIATIEKNIKIIIEE